jgi:hypothetical protein
MTYQDWISNNYLFLQKWSRIWCVNNDDADELLTLFTIYLSSNWQKYLDMPNNNERIKFTQTWLKNNVKWSNSEFNRLKRVNSHEEEWEQKDDKTIDDLIEVRCENSREDIIDWLIDLNRNYTEHQVDKLVKLREIYLQLNIPDKVLWDMYWTNGLSLRDIGKKLDIPHLSVWTMIKELKEKIIIIYGTNI